MTAETNTRRQLFRGLAVAVGLVVPVAKPRPKGRVIDGGGVRDDDQPNELDPPADGGAG